MHITLQNLTKSFGAREIFTDFSLEIQSGVRLCVCGPNGCGKSTLLRTIAGVESADAGKVITPKGCRMGFVAQELDSVSLEKTLLDFVLEVVPDWSGFWSEWEEANHKGDEAAIARLSSRQAELEHLYGYNPETRAKTVLSGLGFAESKWSMSLASLSGGWRERAKLARVLTAGADLLILDEPTNHLDLEAVDWLESFLLDYKGVLVFVAHDRIFMDKIGTHVLYMAGNKPLFRKGNFSSFIAQQGEAEAQREREAVRLQSEIERKMDFVRRFKAKATKARQAASRAKMAKKLEKELEGLEAPQRQKNLGFSWPVAPPCERTVLAVSDLEFSFPDGRKMWDSLSFHLYRGQKIALVGPNGCGKSTLLKLLTSKLGRSSGSVVLSPSVRLGYFTQHQMETLNAAGTVLGEIRRLSDPKTTEEELMSVLGLFLLGQNYFERLAGDLSGGEKSRLLLACLFLARNNFLVLDEPTNHLDLESREALVEALADYEGTLFMVAHDRYLLSNVAEQIWELGPHGFKVYLGGFEEYDAARRSAAQEARSLLAGAAGEKDDDEHPRSREEQKKLKREQAEQRNRIYKEQKPLQEAYDKAEKELEVLLNRQGELEASMADPSSFSSGETFGEMMKEFNQIQQKCEDLMENLVELEQKLAELEVLKQSLAI